MGLEHVLDAVEDDVEELLRVLLDGGVGGLAVEVLEAEAEVGGVVVLALGELQVRHEPLQLVQQVVVDHLALVILELLGQPVVRRQQLVAERRHHVKLLQHRVQVANAPEVTQADEAAGLGLADGVLAPALAALDLAEQRREAVVEVLEEEQLGARAERVEQVLRGLAALLHHLVVALHCLDLHELGNLVDALEEAAINLLDQLALAN